VFIWLISICLAQAPLLHCSVTPSEPNVVTLSSSDTKEALELLSLSPTFLPHSWLVEPSSSFGSDLFDNWPEANDMATSVYVALIMDASSFCTSAIDVLQGELEPWADSSPARQSRSRAAPSWRSHRKQPRSVDAPHRRSKRVKRYVIDSGSMAAPLRSVPLSAVDFDSAEWEIMYRRFVEEGLIDPPNRASEWSNCCLLYVTHLCMSIECYVVTLDFLYSRCATFKSAFALCLWARYFFIRRSVRCLRAGFWFALILTLAHSFLYAPPLSGLSMCQDLALASLILFAEQNAKTLREAFISFSSFCLSP
jgi:hypothetical protein